MNTVNVLFLNVPRQIKRFLPTFADTAFRTPLCLLEFGKRSAVPFRSVTEPTNPQCSPESRVKTEPTWTNTSPSFPSAGAPAGPQWGDFEPTWRSQWVSRNAYGKSSTEKPSSFVGKYWRLRWRIIIKERAAHDFPTAIQLAIFLH